MRLSTGSGVCILYLHRGGEFRVKNKVAGHTNSYGPCGNLGRWAFHARLTQEISIPVDLQHLEWGFGVSGGHVRHCMTRVAER
jgi:hypothetical protein